MTSILLIGLPGSGKSTLAPILAEELGWDWKDTDGCLEVWWQMNYGGFISYRDLFLKVEEEGFRYVEYQAIKQLKDKKALVIATGGGSCTNTSTAKLLKEMGTVIYLKQSPSTVKKRLSSTFPITDQFLEKRLPLYAAAAHITIDVEGLSIDEVVKQILEQYGK